MAGWYRLRRRSRDTPARYLFDKGRDGVVFSASLIAFIATFCFIFHYQFGTANKLQHRNERSIQFEGKRFGWWSDCSNYCLENHLDIILLFIILRSKFILYQI